MCAAPCARERLWGGFASELMPRLLCGALFLIRRIAKGARQRIAGFPKIQYNTQVRLILFAVCLPSGLAWLVFKCSLKKPVTQWAAGSAATSSPATSGISTFLLWGIPARQRGRAAVLLQNLKHFLTLLRCSSVGWRRLKPVLDDPRSSAT